MLSCVTLVRDLEPSMNNILNLIKNYEHRKAQLQYPTRITHLITMDVPGRVHILLKNTLKYNEHTKAFAEQYNVQLNLLLIVFNKLKIEYAEGCSTEDVKKHLKQLKIIMESILAIE